MYQTSIALQAYTHVKYFSRFAIIMKKAIQMPWGWKTPYEREKRDMNTLSHLGCSFLKPIFLPAQLFLWSRLCANKILCK